MPELPEVETVVRGISPSLEGQMIADVVVRNRSFRKPIPTDFEKQVVGKTVERVERRAKYIIITLDKGLSVLWHLGMSGRVTIVEEAKPDFAKHDHVAFKVKGGNWIVFNDARRFGLMDVCETDELAQHSFMKNVGPEPLSNSFNSAVLGENLAGKKSAIKQALLDGRNVAGVGNIYACEALFRSNINPKREAGKISKAKLDILCREIRSVLLEAIEAGGSTLKDHAQVDGELGYFQHQFKTYGREGEPCVTTGCNSKIKRIVQGGRSTFYCSKCQK